MIMDPMAKFTKEDYDAIKRKREYETIMDNLERIEIKLNEKELNHELETEVARVIDRDFPYLYDKFFIQNVIDYIKRKYTLRIVKEKKYLHLAIMSACNYCAYKLNHNEDDNKKELLLKKKM